MKQLLFYAFLCLLALGLGACSKKDEPKQQELSYDTFLDTVWVGTSLFKHEPEKLRNVTLRFRPPRNIP